MKEQELAFILIIGSGLMSPFGALIATCAPTHQVRVIPIALGFSVGVLVWVALVALHPESLEFFEEALHDNNEDHLTFLPRFFVMLSIGGGMLVGMMLDKIVHCLGFEHHHNHKQSMAAFEEKIAHREHLEIPIEDGGGKASELQVLAITDHHHHHHHHQDQHNRHHKSHHKKDKHMHHPHSHQSPNNNNNNNLNPHNADLEKTKSGSYEPPSMSNSMADFTSPSHTQTHTDNNNHDSFDNDSKPLVKQSSTKKIMSPNRDFKSAYGTHDSTSYTLMSDSENRLTQAQSRGLLRAGCITSLAVIAHNFPEGLATFTSTVSDPNLGALVAIAVALHNIPLGITVAVPIYLAEGAKCKAILFASFAGLSSLVGGLVGWLLYTTSDEKLGNNLNGALFGCVIGIMVWTAFKELLPQAREHDPHDKYTSWLVFAGFLVMDISLVIFDSQDTSLN